LDTRAERVIGFIEGLTVTAGMHAGQPFRLRDWQKQIIHAWYATDAEGRRIVRTGLLSMGRKNGKTSLCAALALAHLVGPEVEARGQVILAASDRDQAGLAYNEVVAFINTNKSFIGRTNIKAHAKLIEDLVSGTTLFVVSSDAKKAHGLSPSVIIIDELAQWGMGRGIELYDALDTATGARAEPFQMIISTQAADDIALLSELIDLGKRITRGEIQDPTFSAHHFEVPMEADPFDETQWRLANPALGDFRSLEEMRAAAKKAQQMPIRLASFRRYYLNQRVATEERWIPADAWEACRAAPPAPLAGRRAWLGLDLSSKRDLSALACVIPDDEGGYDVAVDFWCPKENIAVRTVEDRVPYALWVDQGYLTATPGNIVDYSFIKARIAALCSQYEVVNLAVDPWNAQDLIAQLMADSIPVVEVFQTLARLTTASKMFEALILSRQLRHTGNPVLTWNVTNAVARMDGNENIKADKERSAERIDGLSAIISALSVALVAPPNPSAIFESRGMLVLG
jgi:phage terminase large subunit-like protein